jgi:hypothetical protein
VRTRWDLVFLHAVLLTLGAGVIAHGVDNDNWRAVVLGAAIVLPFLFGLRDLRESRR